MTSKSDFCAQFNKITQPNYSPDIFIQMIHLKDSFW